jgi:DNA polymerase III subunit chi
MPAAAFYQLKSHTPEQALCRLLEKALAGGGKAVVRLGSEEEMEALDAALWTLDPDSFLPHATIKAKAASDQPVLLTTGKEAPNRASLAFLLPGAGTEGIDAFERTFVLFDGGREAQLNQAWALWKDLKAKGWELAYWTQNAGGGWEKQEL